MEQLSARRTVPQIFIDGKSIGGFDETRRLDVAGELDRLLGQSMEAEYMRYHAVERFISSAVRSLRHMDANSAFGTNHSSAARRTGKRSGKAIRNFTQVAR